jgi:hypothetical protein
MKKILSVITIAASLVACNSSSSKNAEAEKNAMLAAYRDSIKMAADTAGFSEFRNWKAQSELGQTEQYDQNQYTAAPVAPTRSYAPARSTSRSTATRRASSSSNRGTVYNSTSGQAAKKKGWSKTAKGAVIGGAGGAVIGGVVNKKNRAAGAVIGGVGGAVIGGVIGRSQDKKDGRY